MEVLVAILIVSIASAALAASVGSATSMNATGIKIDNEYKEDLYNANNQVGGTDGVVSFSDDDSVHAVTVFGSGDLSTASGDVGDIVGGDTGDYMQGTNIRVPEKKTDSYKVDETPDNYWGSLNIGNNLMIGDVVNTYKRTTIGGAVQDFFHNVFGWGSEAEHLYFIALEQIEWYKVTDDAWVKIQSELIDKKISYTDPLTNTTHELSRLWNITKYVEGADNKITSLDFDDMVQTEGCVFKEGTIVYKNDAYYICTYTHEASQNDYVYLDNDSYLTWVKINN